LRSDEQSVEAVTFRVTWQLPAASAAEQGQHVDVRLKLTQVKGLSLLSRNRWLLLRNNSFGLKFHKICDLLKYLAFVSNNLSK